MEKILDKSIPVSISLKPLLEAENIRPEISFDKKRVLTITFLAFCVAIASSIISKLLIFLIDGFTNLAFYQTISFEPSSPSNNTLGVFVIVVPVIGGLIVGLMAHYSSKAIRGHGIPEAMEQILTNQSKIKPSIMYLKPLSAAISIGTGGPFGAEGPIIATGGALGSAFGQTLKITHHERKILLAAGATAGMAAIFGSPIAAIFLAIELLLFEFSPRSLVPVTIACITGTVGHHILFGSEPVFGSSIIIGSATNTALLSYSIMGIVIGLLSVLITKSVYFIEDSFEKLPFHWKWWPAIGGLFVGVIGYFAPRTLGVGYNNITEVLGGNVPIQIVFSLCVFKFISWAVSLGSGTSGGTLAPLLTIGGAVGALLGHTTLLLFPSSGTTVALAALVGMSAMFAGASRAFITSIIFALETTGQTNALLPLLATCSASYLVSFFLMKNSIMTEKIARRGIVTPDSYEADRLEKVMVEDVLQNTVSIIHEKKTIKEMREAYANHPKDNEYVIVSGDNGEYKGILNCRSFFSSLENTTEIGKLVSGKMNYIQKKENLRTALNILARNGSEALPVVSEEDRSIIGILSFTDIITSYGKELNENEKKESHLSLKNYRLRIFGKERSRTKK